MNTIAITPVQWSMLKNIDDVDPINDSDADCLADIREILKKHGKMSRFGVALLHSHFEMASDEIMVESSDEAGRKLETKPITQSDADKNLVGTIWMLRDGDVTTMLWCRKYCSRGVLLGHSKVHQRAK